METARSPAPEEDFKMTSTATPVDSGDSPKTEAPITPIQPIARPDWNYNQPLSAIPSTSYGSETMSAISCQGFSPVGVSTSPTSPTFGWSHPEGIPLGMPSMPPMSPTPTMFPGGGSFEMPPVSPGPLSPTSSVTNSSTFGGFFTADFGLKHFCGDWAAGPSTASLYDCGLESSQVSTTDGNNNAVTAEEGGGEKEVGGVVEGATSGAPTAEDDFVKAVVEEGGYISLHLRFGVRVDIAPNQAIRIINTRKAVDLGLSGCATQMSMVHPQGRVLQYNSRIEVQVENYHHPTSHYPSVKNAKVWPRGVSFTSNNCALVYLVDAAGARSTTDTFHDLYADNISETVFSRSTQVASCHYQSVIEKCKFDLNEAEYWRNSDIEPDCWVINGVQIKQTHDGLVTVERKYGNEVFQLRTSPSNGKVRLQSSFLYLTASMGDEAHVFIKSNERRIHYNGSAFVVRNAGHSAGFDETGLLRIW